MMNECASCQRCKQGINPISRLSDGQYRPCQPLTEEVMEEVQQRGFDLSQHESPEK